MRFVHTADNHIDKPLSTLDGDKIAIRKAQRRQSFSKIIDYVLINNVDMLLISGDLFDSPTPSHLTVAFCADQFKRLGDIPVFISLGNHDYGIDGSDFPGNVHIFPGFFDRITYKDTVITGASFASENASLASLVPEVDNYKTNILLLHGDTETKSSYNPLDIKKLRTLGYDYIALGHIHKYIKTDNIVYPGCHDGGGFDETGIKGFVSGEVSNHALSLEFVPSSTLIYEEFDFDISSFSSSLAIADALNEKLSDGIYSVNLTGTLKEGFVPNIKYITSSLSKPFHVSVKDKTTQDTDISESSIYKIFADYLKNNYDEETAQLALRYGIRALKGVREDI